MSLKAGLGQLAACLALAMLLASCGVKGDPVRPAAYITN